MAADHTFDFLDNETNPVDSSASGWDMDSFLADLNSVLSSDTKPESVPQPEKGAEPTKKVSPAPKKQAPAPKTAPAPSPDSAQAEDSAPKASKEKTPRKKQKTQTKQKAPKSKKKHGKSHALLNVILTALMLLLVCGIAIIILMNTDSDPYNSRILQNVSIAGVDVGGMTKEEAMAAVKKSVGNSYFETPMIVTMGKMQVVLSPANTHANLNATNAVNLAYDLGRSGTSAERQKTYLISQTSQIALDITSALNLNVSYIRDALEEAIEQISTEYQPSGYTLSGEAPALDAENFDSTAPCQTLILTLGQPGAHADLDAIYLMVLEAFSKHEFQVTIPSDLVADYPDALDLYAIADDVCVAPVEAEEDPVTRECTPGSCGYTFSIESAQAQLGDADYGDVIYLPMEYVLPKNLELNGIYTETLSTYSTVVGDEEAYNANMSKICKLLDGVVIEPGKLFSLNGLVGNRVAEKGYQNAPVHAKYCIYEEVGGGADQVASTLYVAALQAGLTVTEKHFADHVCAYTLTGTELTIGSNWQDLKIRNELNMSVKIRAKVTKDQVVIRILGEDALDYTIKLDISQNYSSPFGTMFVEKSAASGYKNKQVLADGINGGEYVVKVVKCDKATGQEISHKSEFVNIKPANKVVVTIR